MSRLVVVVPLEAGSRERARRLLEQGPPFDPASTQLTRHEVYLTDREAVFVFEAAEDAAALELHAEDPLLHRAAAEWRELMAGRPQKAEPVFAWEAPRLRRGAPGGR